MSSLKIHQTNLLYFLETLTGEVNDENVANIIHSYSIRASGRISLALSWHQRRKLIRKIPISRIDSKLGNLGQSLSVSGLTSLGQ